MGRQGPQNDPLDQLRGALDRHLAHAEGWVADADARGEGRAFNYLRRAVDQTQTMLGWSADELARRSFLQDLIVRLFIIGTDRLTWEIRTIEPFGITGLVVTARGIAGAAQVLPVSVSIECGKEKRAYGAFPGAGQPQYELRIIDGPADGWASRPSLYFLSADPGQITSVIGAWRDATPLLKHVTPPLGPADLAPLRALAAVRRSLTTTSPAADWDALGLALGFARADPPGKLTPEAQVCLAADLNALDPARLLANLPRDEKGRLRLETEVLLARYDSNDIQLRGRALWLVARTPARRRDPQTVTLDLDILPGDERRHRWDATRWLWDRRDSADEAARWGVAGLEIDRLGLGNRAAELARLRERQGPGDLTPAERVALCLLLQDEGQLAEAFAACGVELASEVTTILAGGEGHCLSDKQATHWPTTIQTALRAAASWRFAAILDAEEARLAARVAGKRRRRPPARLRLLSLPYQQSIRKAALMLARAADGQTPRLEIEWTGSNAILPEVAWRRATELDLRRFGLA